MLGLKLIHVSKRGHWCVGERRDNQDRDCVCPCWSKLIKSVGSGKYINPLFMNLCYISLYQLTRYVHGHTKDVSNQWVFFFHQMTAEISKRPIHPAITLPLAHTYHLIFLYVDSENGILGLALSFKQKAFSRMLSCDWLMAFSVSAVYLARIKENKINRNMIHIWLWKKSAHLDTRHKSIHFPFNSLSSDNIRIGDMDHQCMRH